MIRRNGCSPLLSVVIPVYNTEDYLDRCIRSVMGQTYQNLEIILVDDGSTDNSGNLCDIYAAEDSRIKVIHKENGGVVSARKAGIRIAAGEYLAYVDSDDWIEEGMYLDLLSLIKESDADIVTSGCIRDYGTHRMIQKEGMEPGIYEKEKLLNEFLPKMMSTDAFCKPNVMFTVWNKIYKKELAEQWQNQVDDLIYSGDDAALVYPCMLSAGKIAVSGNNYYHYCIREGSMTGNKKRNELQRYQVLFHALEEQGIKHKDRVPNIMEQIKLYEYHLMLIQHVSEVVQYRNGILFPFGKLGQDERIVIYGAGKFGCELKNLLTGRYSCRIAAWVDKTEKAGTQPAECLDRIPYDKIIIAVLVADVAAEIKKELMEKGIKEEKILTVDVELLIRGR